MSAGKTKPAKESNMDRIGHRSLDALHTLGDGPHWRCQALSAHLGISNSTAHDVLSRLLKMGMVHRRPAVTLGGNMGRSPALWRITSRGRARLLWELDRGREPGVSAVAAIGRHNWPMIPKEEASRATA